MSFGASEKPPYYEKRQVSAVVLVHLDSDDFIDSYQQQCNEFLKLALQGVSVFVSSGDSGSACDEIGRTKRQIWFHEQPAGCPWVTGVGATQIGKGKTVHDPEGAAIEGWSGISSSGGFSNIFDIPVRTPILSSCMSPRLYPTTYAQRFVRRL